MREPAVFQYNDYRAYLRDYYEFRRQGRRGFSYSIWARQLALKSPSTLIMILNGQRHPGPRLTKKLQSYLTQTEDQQKYFADLIRLAKVRSDVRECMAVMKALQERNPEKGFRLLEKETFDAMSNWYYPALREMVQLPGFQENEKWLAERFRFKVAPRDVRRALDSLLQLGLLERDRQGRLRATNTHLETSKDIASEAIQSYHEQTLDNIKQSLKSLPPNQREISGVSFAVDAQTLPKAKELIRKFQVEMVQLLENSRGDALYHLEVAYLPLAELPTKEPAHESATIPS